MPALSNQVAIITGASSGIGKAAALRFAAEGASLVIGARRADVLASVAAEISKAGGTVVALAGDVGDASYARDLVALALDRYGSLSVAFNNAGTLGAMGPTPDITLHDWRTTLETNLTSAFLAAKYQIPAMIRHGSGSLIFTSSFVGYSAGFPGVAAYAASKAGLVGLTQSLATELGPLGIRVNALLPGGSDTPMGREMADSPESLAHVASLHALRRISRPEEIASAALFLASEQASFVTGSAMMVDGGVSVFRS